MSKKQENLLVPSIDFITHSAVMIEAEVEDVWPYILYPNSWKTGDKLVPVGGEQDALGERFKAMSDDGTGLVHFYVENVEVVPLKRRTVRLETVDGDLVGYATWVLTPGNGITHVEYHVYCCVSVGGAGTSKPSRVEQDEMIRIAHLRMDEEFVAMKCLVEGWR